MLTRDRHSSPVPSTGVREDPATPSKILPTEVAAAAQTSILLHDRDGDGHYDLLSAFHKSLRASDADAAIYYATRLIASGEDPLVVLRRMIRMASEDVGLADHQALVVTMAARDAYVQLGPPEGHLALIQAATYLARAPKSDELYQAHKAALAALEETGSLPVPLHLRNAPTALPKSLGHGDGYVNPHRTVRASQLDSQAPPNLPGPLARRRFLRGNTSADPEQGTELQPHQPKT
jgi:putative ATPase